MMAEICPKSAVIGKNHAWVRQTKNHDFCTCINCGEERKFSIIEKEALDNTEEVQSNKLQIYNEMGKRRTWLGYEGAILRTELEEVTNIIGAVPITKESIKSALKIWKGYNPSEKLTDRWYKIMSNLVAGEQK